MPQDKTPKKTAGRPRSRVRVNGEAVHVVGARCKACGRSAADYFTARETRWETKPIAPVFCRGCAPVRINRARLERSFGLAVDELRKAVDRDDRLRVDEARTRLLSLFAKALDAGLIEGDPKGLVAETAGAIAQALRERALTQRRRGPTLAGRAKARARAHLLAAMGAAEEDAYNAAMARGESVVFVTAPAAAKLGQVLLAPGDTEQAFKARAKRHRKTHPKAAARHDRKVGEFWRPLLRAAGPSSGGRKRDESAT